MKAIVAKRLKSDPWLKTKSISEVHALAREGKEKEAEAAALLQQQQAASEAPPLQSATTAAAAAAASSEAMETDTVEDLPEPVLIDMIAPTAFAQYSVDEEAFLEDKKGKGKGKRKSATAPKAKAGAKRKASELSPLSKKFARRNLKSQGPSPTRVMSAGAEGLLSGSVENASQAGSHKTGGGKRSSAGSLSPGEQAIKLVSDLSLDAALSGQSLKTPLYNSRRWLQGEKAKEKGQTDSAEYVTLSAKYDLIVNAVRLFDLLGEAATGERTKLMEDVMRSTKHLPPQFCTKHLTAAVKEEPLNTEAAVSHWLAMIEPAVTGD